MSINVYTFPDICETCINTERRYSQALPSAMSISADPILSSAKPSTIPGSVIVQQATESASFNPRYSLASGISASDSDTEILCSNQPRKSLNVVEEIEVSILQEPVIPYPQTDLQELETSFHICNDFRRQGLSKFYQW